MKKILQKTSSQIDSQTVKSYQRNKFHIQVLIGFGLLACAFASGNHLLELSDFSVSWSEFSLYLFGDGGNIYEGFFAPSTSPEKLWEYIALVFDTLLIAFLSSFLSVPLGFVLSIGMSKNLMDLAFSKKWHSTIIKTFVFYTCKIIANLMRSVNELIWALILVAAIGLGPLAGIIALGIHSGGVAAKLFSERLEDINSDAYINCLLDGNSSIKAFWATIIPEFKPHFISTILYRLETDIRSSTVIGIVGGGGIGMTLKNSLENFETSQAAVIILIIVCLIFVIDHISSRLRKRYVA